MRRGICGDCARSTHNDLRLTPSPLAPLDIVYVRSTQCCPHHRPYASGAALIISVMPAWPGSLRCSDSQEHSARSHSRYLGTDLALRPTKDAGARKTTRATTKLSYRPPIYEVNCED